MNKSPPCRSTQFVKLKTNDGRTKQTNFSNKSSEQWSSMFSPAIASTLYQTKAFPGFRFFFSSCIWQWYSDHFSASAQEKSLKNPSDIISSFFVVSRTRRNWFLTKTSLFYTIIHWFLLKLIFPLDFWLYRAINLVYCADL